MRSVYLVARRDYLGYVTSIGFWIGMLLTPLLMGLGALAPGFIENATSVRYYAVIEQGDTFTKELDKQVKGGLFDRSNAKTFRVDVPISNSDEISDYMLSGETVDGPEGPKIVETIVYVSSDGQTVEYWQENSGGGITSEVKETIEILAQRKTFSEAGVDTNILKQAERAEADFREKIPRTIAEGGSRDRTLEDEIPRVVSVIIAFFLWIMIFSVVNYLLMGTIEERANKIFDTLLTSVKLPQLLAGKAPCGAGCLCHAHQLLAGRRHIVHDICVFQPVTGNCWRFVNGGFGGAETQHRDPGSDQFCARLLDVWGVVPRGWVALRHSSGSPNVDDAIADFAYGTIGNRGDIDRKPVLTACPDHDMGTAVYTFLADPSHANRSALVGSGCAARFNGRHHDCDLVDRDTNIPGRRC